MNSVFSAASLIPFRGLSPCHPLCRIHALQSPCAPGWFSCCVYYFPGPWKLSFHNPVLLLRLWRAGSAAPSGKVLLVVLTQGEGSVHHTLLETSPNQSTIGSTGPASSTIQSALAGGTMMVLTVVSACLAG